MPSRFQTAFCILAMLCGSVCLAQNYRCDWSVVGTGGGEMSSGAYRCVATAGQTAVGFMTSPDYWALVGYWLPEEQSGVQEAGPEQGSRVTRLYAPQPNPARAHVAISYSLSAESRVSLSVHDVAGRVVKTLSNGPQKSGRYSVAWDGRDAHGRGLANGIYFLKFSAGGYRQTEKLVLQH